MKVLHVYRTYFPDPPGGLQEAIRQICLSTKALGCENSVFALSAQPAPTVVNRPEARVVRSRSWAAPASCDLGWVASIREFSEQASWADVIHYHFPWPFLDLLDLSVRPKKPKVMTYHSDIVRQRLINGIYRPLMIRTLREMDAVVATSSAYAETSGPLSKSVPAGTLRVIPLGIEESSYPPYGDDAILRRLGLFESEPYFLFIGVLRYYKGLHTMLEAAREVNVKVVIAGSGPEGEALRDQAQRLGLRNVIFAGQVTDEEKVALLESCYGLLLPSHLRSEAYGMVLVEASMYGKPMVSCEIGTGTSFVNEDNETGYVIPPEKPFALADAMNKLLIDPQQADSMGKRARNRYERLFSGVALGKAYADLYENVIESH